MHQELLVRQRKEHPEQQVRPELPGRQRKVPTEQQVRPERPEQQEQQARPGQQVRRWSSALPECLQTSVRQEHPEQQEHPGLLVRQRKAPTERQRKEH